MALAEFARHLQALVPPGCAIGRLGGDAFAILASTDIDLPELNGIARPVSPRARYASN